MRRPVMTTIVIAFVLLVVAVLIVLLRSETTQPDQGDLQAEMKLAAADAVDVAKKRYGLTLDYSPASVETVESILAQLHDLHKTAPFAAAREKEEGWRWGAYVGEVILRISPGRWEVDHPAGGPRSYPVRVARGESFPIGWCRKRILNGPEDNVWHKFQVLYMDTGRSGLTAYPDGRVEPQ